MTEASEAASAALRLAARGDLRKRLLAERDAFAASADSGRAANALAAALSDVLVDLEPDCLGLYWPVRSEFNAALALGADARFTDLALALPYARRSDRQMEFRRWDGSPPTLRDEHGIECCDGAVVVPDVALVPCVGFTADGHRLGYGGGYFDRWLATHGQVTTVGIAWSFAEIEPAIFVAQPHDIALALIVTERGVR